MSSTESIISIVIACVSLVGTIGLGVWNTLYKSSLEAAQRQRDIRRQVQRYKDPLLLSAWELQSRLFDLLDTKIPDKEVSQHAGKQDLTVFSSYLLAHFLAWAWILRERTQFLAFSDAPHWIKLREVLYKIEDELDRKFSQGISYGAQPSDRLLVSELAVVSAPGEGDDLPLRPIRWNEFQRDWEKTFAGPLKWYTDQIMGSLNAKMKGATPKDQRLRRIQHLLVDLIGILDPDETMKSDRPDEHRKCKPADWCDCEDKMVCWEGSAEELKDCKTRRQRHDEAHRILKRRREEQGKRVEMEQGAVQQVQTLKRGPDPDLEKGVPLP
ncbi:hypothetical protein QBC47DRAFT_392823 [Echria macrotheca]|uniref:Uncharacterized protein n=1 Tax=Echria macrotheca TaxID=438768 RepID=A0AAJ0B5Q4_9PEZI|nr:hypothetical protein QBC47DRAFT_392823 [Echria macrotheca]